MPTDGGALDRHGRRSCSARPHTRANRIANGLAMDWQRLAVGWQWVGLRPAKMRKKVVRARACVARTRRAQSRCVTARGPPDLAAVCPRWAHHTKAHVHAPPQFMAACHQHDHAPAPGLPSASVHLRPMSTDCGAPDPARAAQLQSPVSASPRAEQRTLLARSVCFPTSPTPCSDGADGGAVDGAVVDATGTTPKIRPKIRRGMHLLKFFQPD